MPVKLGKDTARVLLICGLVSFLAFLVAFFYYRHKNRSADPRVREAVRWLDRSDELISSGKTMEAMRILDSASHIFNALPAYDGSYEHGIIHNNRCSALLMTALYDSSLLAVEKERLLRLARAYADTSLHIYDRWMETWEGLGKAEILQRLSPGFEDLKGDYSSRRLDAMLQNRTDQIEMAKMETPRRMSVAYTNLGTICRHSEEPDSALYFFQKALELWKHNRTAASNLEVLKGGKPVKPGVIESLFPPDKYKTE